MSTANSVNSGLDCASPESIMDPTNLTPIGDQYSLGCVLYYCLTGQLSVPGRHGGREDDGPPAQAAEADPGVDPDLAPELVAVVERLMKKQPEQRYANCGEAAEALRAFAPQQARRQAPRTHTTMQAVQQRPPVPPLPPLGPSGAPATWNKGQVPMPSLANLPVVNPQRAPAHALPTRHTVGQRAQAPAPAPEPSHPAPPQPSQAPASGEKPYSPWKDKIGTIGVAICAVLATIAVWYLASKFLF